MNKGIKVLLVIIALIGLFFYRVFVLQKVWCYIAVKGFHLPMVTFWQAFAISWLATCFTSDWSTKSNIAKDADESMERMMQLVLATTWIWGLTYLIYG